MEKQAVTKFVARVRSDKEKKIEELAGLDNEELETLNANIENNLEHIVLAGNSYSKQFCSEIAELFKKSTKLTVKNSLFLRESLNLFLFYYNRKSISMIHLYPD